MVEVGKCYFYRVGSNGLLFSPDFVKILGCNNNLYEVFNFTLNKKTYIQRTEENNLYLDESIRTVSTINVRQRLRRNYKNIEWYSNDIIELFKSFNVKESKIKETISKDSIVRNVEDLKSKVYAVILYKTIYTNSFDVDIFSANINFINDTDDKVFISLKNIIYLTNKTKDYLDYFVFYKKNKMFYDEEKLFIFKDLESAQIKRDQLFFDKYSDILNQLNTETESLKINNQLYEALLESKI